MMVKKIVGPSITYTTTNDVSNLQLLQIKPKTD